MATNLTPEQLAALQAAMYQNGSGYVPTDSNYNYTDPSGNTFHTTYLSGGSGIEQSGGDVYGPATGFLQDAVPGQNNVGDTQYMYDLYGKYLGSGVIPKDTSFRDFLALGAAMGLAGFATALNPALGATGSASVAGPGEAGWGMSLDSVTGGSGSELLNGGSWMTSPAGTSAGNLLQGSSASMVAPAASNAAFNSALGSGAGALSGLLGPAATLLGGLAGAQGQSASTTTAKDIPEWLKPYVTGSDGILSKANSLLQQQTAPGALAGFDQMKSVGMNLLNQPIRPNGFNLFTGR